MEQTLSRKRIYCCWLKKVEQIYKWCSFLTKLDVPQTAEQLTVAGADEVGDLQYYAYATNFPVLTKFYAATPKTETLDVGDVTFGRVDLILANRPDVVDGMGYITVSKGTPSLGAQPNNIDLATQYIIKWVFVAANSTTGVDVSPKPSRTYLSEFTNDGNGDITKPFITVDDLSNNTIQSVVGGNNITIDNTDPLNPIISSIASTYPPPYIDVVIPDSTLPSTTGNFELHGSNFKEDMTVVFTGQTVNYKVFHSSLHVTVNVTTGATEGLFSIILNNGISRTFPNAYMVVLGTVYTPLNADWITKTGLIDTTDGNKVKVVTYNSTGTAFWNREFNIGINWSLRFRHIVTPLGLANGNGGIHTTDLIDVVTGLSVGVYSFIGVDHYAIGGYYLSSASNAALQIALNPSAYLEYRYMTGILYIYVNNILVATKTSLPNNVRLKVLVSTADIIDIKYIELA